MDIGSCTTSEDQFLYAQVQFILVPPTFGQCPFTSFALATAFVLCCLPSQATTCNGTNYALLPVGVNLPRYGSWNWIWKKILVWNGRFLVWNGNGIEENCLIGIWKKSSSIPFHALDTRI